MPWSDFLALSFLKGVQCVPGGLSVPWGADPLQQVGTRGRHGFPDFVFSLPFGLDRQEVSA